MIDKEYTEGTASRTVRLKIGTGEITVTIGGKHEVVLL